MLWACVVASLVGLFLGLKYRVAMLFGAALLTIAVVVGVALLCGWSVGETVAVLAVLLAVEQAFYVVGLFIAPRH